MRLECPGGSHCLGPPTGGLGIDDRALRASIKIEDLRQKTVHCMEAEMREVNFWDNEVSTTLKHFCSAIAIPAQEFFNARSQGSHLLYLTLSGDSMRTVAW